MAVEDNKAKVKKRSYQSGDQKYPFLVAVKKRDDERNKAQGNVNFMYKLRAACL